MKDSVRYPLNGAVFGPVLMVSLYRLKTWSYRWNHYYRFEYFWLQHKTHKTTPFEFLPLPLFVSPLELAAYILRFSNRRTTPLIPLRFIFSAPKTTPFIRPRHPLLHFLPPFITSWKISLEKVTECQREFFTTKTEVLSTDERTTAVRRT